MTTVPTTSGLFVTKPTMASAATLSAGWNAMFISGSVDRAAVLKDMTALTTALGTTYYGMFPPPPTMQVYQGLTDVGDAISGETTDIKAESHRISALLDKLPQSSLLFARTKLFGKSHEAFLTRKALKSSDQLVASWDALFEGARKMVEGKEEDALEDLALLAMTLGDVRYSQASRLRGYLDAALSETTPLGIGDMQVMISSFLRRLDDETLGTVSERLFPKKKKAPPKAAAAELVPRTVTGFKIKLDGVETQVPAEGVKIYPTIDGISDREPVSSTEEERATARSNMQTAVEDYLSGEMFDQLITLLPAHLQAVISGEIAVPVEDREKAVTFIAQSPEHAAAYGKAVLIDAVQAGAISVPLPVMPELDGLSPITRVRPEGDRIPRAGMTPGGVANLDRMAWELHLLLTSADPEVQTALADLAEANPAAFSRDVLGQLYNAAKVVVQLRELRGTSNAGIRGDFIHAAQLFGTIPPEYLTLGRDHEDVEVEMPKLSEDESAAVENWATLLTSYIESTEFQKAVEAIPAASADFPFREKMFQLVQKHRNAVVAKLLPIDMILSADQYVDGLSRQVRWGPDKRKVSKDERFDVARKALINLRISLIREDIINLSKEYELHQFDDFEGQIRSFVESKEYAKAEATLDFVERRTADMVNAVHRAEVIADQLFITAERKAEKEFRRLMMELLSEGRLIALRKLRAKVKKRIQELAAPIRIRSKDQAIKMNVACAVFAVLETIRVLAVLPSAERLKLAPNFPDTLRLTRPGGPATVEHTQTLLLRLGFPIPGLPGVEALPTRIASGMRLPSPEEAPALTGGKDETSSADASE